ncbi:MAG: OmpA family protein [Candidatus Kinetoplastibacterium crithidii]|nr:MAG: OmpA family protein [Candidatus Kinetoplastibacterium crithidii]
MKKSLKMALIIACAAIATSGNAVTNEKNCWTDSFGNPIKNGTNELHWKNSITSNNLKNKVDNASLEKKISLNKNTFFDFDSYILKSESINLLDTIIEDLKNIDIDKVIISGFTDAKGNANYNNKLSENRAESVKNYLIHNGIKSSFISIKANGSKDPIADNNSEEGRAKNRRAEIKVFSKN